MKNKKFKLLRDNIQSLPTGQFRELKEAIEAVESIKFVSKILETPKEDTICPHCDSKNLLRWGKVSDMQRYRCKRCKKTFNSLTKTPLARLRKKGRWLEYSKCLEEGLSVRKAAERCEVSHNTTFRWRHRFLFNAKSIKPLQLSGIVEAQAGIFPLSFKGSKKDYIEYVEKNGKNPSPEKVHVLFCKDRHRQQCDNMIMKFESTVVSKVLKGLISSDSLVCSASKILIENGLKTLGLQHAYIDIVGGETVRKNVVHLNNVLQYKLQLFNWMLRFRGVATKYLDSYLSWFREMDEYNMKVPPKVLLLRAKSVLRYNHQ